MHGINDEKAQAAVVADFASGAATQAAGPLACIDTHMSRVFLGRDHVYKLKRARTHPFVDLADPEHRRRACYAEIEVNQALAPGVYERVAPVVHRAEGYRIDCAGEDVDWVVVMKRLPPDALLDAKADAGQLDASLAADAAKAIASYHATLAPVAGAGRLEDYRRIVQGLARTWSVAAEAQGIAPVPPRIFSRLDAALCAAGPLIEARRGVGRVRRGHGDLHLGNICVLDGRVTPFDALEFDPALATTDVLYDLAFLLMDLRARRLPGPANAAMNAYWDVSGETAAGLALLPVFMALRAGVRMAVAMEAGDPARVKRYHALARRLLAPPTPRLVAIGGLSGTGKSVLAAKLAAGLGGPCGARWLRSDVIRKQEAGAALDQPLGPDAYRPAARAAVYARMTDRAEAALAAGAAVIADATFQSAAARADIAAAAWPRPFLGLWLRCGEDIRLARIDGRRNDPSDISAAQAARQTEPTDIAPTWRIINAGRSPSSAAAQARREIRRWAAARPVQTPGEAS